MNISPKGFYEGFLLQSGRSVIQINLPKEHIGSFADGAAVGKEISVEVEPEEPWGAPAHKVFRLLRIVGDGNGRAEKTAEFSGRIEKLNYALHGEVNGGILDTGDFLHLKPEGAQAIDLAVGMKVQGRGTAKPMVGGRMVIEADEVKAR